MKSSLKALIPLSVIIAILSLMPPVHASPTDPCTTTYRYYYHCRTDASSGLTYYQQFPGQTMSIVNTGASISPAVPNQNQNVQACIRWNYDRFTCEAAVETYCNGNILGAWIINWFFCTPGALHDPRLG